MSAPKRTTQDWHILATTLLGDVNKLIRQFNENDQFRLPYNLVAPFAMALLYDPANPDYRAYAKGYIQRLNSEQAQEFCDRLTLIYHSLQEALRTQP